LPVGEPKDKLVARQAPTVGLVELLERIGPPESPRIFVYAVALGPSLDSVDGMENPEIFTSLESPPE